MDAGYNNCSGFLAPFRGQRYHLSQWTDGPQPNNPREYFNMKHSAARNVIERCFGVLKNRWAILRSPSFFPIKTQNRIILACCLLHNFFMRQMPDDLPEPPCDDQNNLNNEVLPDDLITTVEPSDEWSLWRNNLAEEMYNDWRRRHHL